MLFKSLLILTQFVYCYGIVEREEFVVRIIGGPGLAKNLAYELGFIYKGTVSVLLLFGAR